MAKKEQYGSVVLPPGIAAYSWLAKPDTGHEYSDDKYKITITYDSRDALAAVEEACLAAAKLKFPSIKPADVKLPIRDGDDTGKEEFAGKFLVTAKSQYKPRQVDAKKGDLPASIVIMSGDLVKAVAQLFPYENTEKVKEGGKLKTVTVRGVSLQLGAVQLLDKRNMGRDGGLGLLDEEDGFVADRTSDTGEDSEEAGGDGDF